MSLGLLEEGNSEYWHLLGREHAQKNLDDFFTASGLPRHEYASHSPKVLNEIRLGHIGVHKAILDYMAGLEAYDFSETQGAALTPPQSLMATSDTQNEKATQRPLIEVSGPLLSEVFAARQAEATRSVKWTAKLEADYAVWVGLFLELAGDRPIANYRKADARAFKEVLQELPANRTKFPETNGLGPREAVEVVLVFRPVLCRAAL